MARSKVPPFNVPPINTQSGLWTADYYDIIKQLDNLDPIPADTSFSVAALTPGSTSVVVNVPTLSDASNGPGTGVAHNFIGNNNGSAQALWDSFTTLAAYNNTIRADLLASQTAVGALNTRITALENKLNAVIADLAARFP